jgi:hypothetical protein
MSLPKSLPDARNLPLVEFEIRIDGSIQDVASIAVESHSNAVQWQSAFS